MTTCSAETDDPLKRRELMCAVFQASTAPRLRHLRGMGKSVRIMPRVVAQPGEPAATLQGVAVWRLEIDGVRVLGPVSGHFASRASAYMAALELLEVA